MKSGSAKSVSTKSGPTRPDPARAANPGRPKDLGKRAAILEAAKQMFVAHGFDRVSMDQIAAEAGVSKLTVYSHFGDKESLFSAAISAKCEEQLAMGLFATDPAVPLRERLLGIGRAFVALINSEEAIAVHRIVTAQPRPNTLGRLYWEAGPRRVQVAFEALLRDEIAAGTLEIPDARRAASQFFCLLKGEIHLRLLCDCAADFDEQDRDAHVQSSVDMFLRAYTPPQAQPALAPPQAGRGRRSVRGSGTSA